MFFVRICCSKVEECLSFLWYVRPPTHMSLRLQNDIRAETTQGFILEWPIKAVRTHPSLRREPGPQEVRESITPETRRFANGEGYSEASDSAHYCLTDPS